MYLFLFELYIFKCLNYLWIFIWIIYFKVFELYMGKKFAYDFAIRVYITFFVLCQKCVFDNLSWHWNHQCTCPIVNTKIIDEDWVAVDSEMVNAICVATDSEIDSDNQVISVLIFPSFKRKVYTRISPYLITLPNWIEHKL